MAYRSWSREELILALDLYLKLPFGQIHHKNQEVINLAVLINRTPSSIAMRLSNFATVDPVQKSRGISGLSGGKKQVEPIWNEFADSKISLSKEVEGILKHLGTNEQKEVL